MSVREISLEEQIEIFNEFKFNFGQELALFYACIRFDRPYVNDFNQLEWAAYLDKLKKEKMDVCGGDPVGFLDAQTDVEAVLYEGASEKEKWIITWGVGDAKNPYTDDDYKRLDKIYFSYTARLMLGGGVDERQEDVLRRCARMSLAADKALAKGDKENVSIAATLNKMIQDNLSSENLRRKDEKPVEDLRLDSLADYLEKSGLVKGGQILPLHDLQEALLRRLGALGGKPSHKYPYTLDAADQMILSIANTMYANDGLPELSELPDNMRFDENVACEFTNEPSPEELEVYEYMGLVRRKKGEE